MLSKVALEPIEDPEKLLRAGMVLPSSVSRAVEDSTCPRRSR